MRLNNVRLTIFVGRDIVASFVFYSIDNYYLCNKNPLKQT